jgi:hypothetical protein
MSVIAHSARFFPEARLTASIARLACEAIAPAQAAADSFE